MAISTDFYLGLKNGLFDTTSRANLEQLFQRCVDSDRLVIHFHGGLVPAEAAMTTIETSLLAAYQAAGAYPVFFVWHSDAVEIISHNLAEIWQEKIYQRLRSRVLQFVEAKFRQSESERGGLLELKDPAEIEDELNQPQVNDEPFAELDQRQLLEDETLRPIEADQFKKLLERDPVLKREAEAIANGLRSPEEIEQQQSARGGTVQASRHSLMSPEVLEEIQREAPSPEDRGLFSTAAIVKGTIAVLARVIQRLAKKRDHGVYCTVVEEILREFYLANAGKLVWDWMKGDTADAFGPDPQRYGGTAFLECLQQQWAAGHRPRLILVGHSTGAVYICHLLKQAAATLPAEAQFEVIFLAPACDFRLLADTLSLYGERVKAFRLFGMQDSLEAQDNLVPPLAIYPRSLLYFVSGVLEDEADKPIVGMQRFYSGQPPFDEAAYPEIEIVRRFLAATPGRTVWSEADGGTGLASAARSHGDFDDADPVTLASLKYIIQEGL
jgi:hypothetical protein